MVNGIGSSSSSITEMYQQMFSKIDTNSDGSINNSEMSALLDESSSNLTDSLFSTLDADQDSLISSMEFSSGLDKLNQEMKKGMDGTEGVSGMAGSPPPPPPDQVFDAADADEDGLVTKDELASVIGNDGADIDELFAQVDTDGDGSITRTEDETFRAQMKETAGQSDASSETATTSTESPDWTSRLVHSLLQSLNATSYSSVSSTSLLA
jgi:Ca2+-binding EF-hand superfamily protein